MSRVRIISLRDGSTRIAEKGSKGTNTIHHPTNPPVVADRPALGSLAVNEDGNRKPWWRVTSIDGRPLGETEMRIFD